MRSKTRTSFGGDDQRFERWLSRRLHAAYDAPLHETVPPELTQLVKLFSVAAAPEARNEDTAGALVQVDRLHHCPW